MPKLIMFLGIQLSGKSTFAKKIADAQNIPFLSIDEVRRSFYGQLSGPKDWVNQERLDVHNSQTKQAYDYLFAVMQYYLFSGHSFVVEMPHLGDREEELKTIITYARADLKIIWCHISQDSDEEIQKRINSRAEDKNSAQIRLEDYRMFRAKIKKPSLSNVLEVDTAQNYEVCLESINKYLEN